MERVLRPSKQMARAKRQGVMLVLVAALFVALALCGKPLADWLGWSAKPPEAEQTQEPRPTDSGNETARNAPQAQIGFRAPSMEASRTLMDRFNAANSMEERRACVVPKAGIDQRMINFYQLWGGQNPRIVKLISETSPSLVAGQTCAELVYECDNRVSSRVSALLFLLPDGSVALDWESFVAYSEKDWQDLRSRRSPQAALYRAYAAPGDHYANEFADAAKYLNVTISSPDGAVQVHGYCPRGSPAAVGFESLFEGGQGRAAASFRPVTVRLEYPAQAQSEDCLYIRELVAKSWLTPMER